MHTYQACRAGIHLSTGLCLRRAHYNWLPTLALKNPRQLVGADPHNACYLGQLQACALTPPPLEQQGMHEQHQESQGAW